MRPVKRRWALLESNPPRNNRLELIAWVGRGAQKPGLSVRFFESHAKDSLMPWKTHGRCGWCGFEVHRRFLQGLLRPGMQVARPGSEEAWAEGDFFRAALVRGAW